MLLRFLAILSLSAALPLGLDAGSAMDPNGSSATLDAGWQMDPNGASFAGGPGIDLDSRGTMDPDG